MPKLLKKVKRKRKTPIYNIGAVSQLTGIPIWTVRWIEKHELIAPHRSHGNHRLFSDEDLDLLNQIRDLLEEGVNLPGIRVILRMRIEES